MRYIFFTSALCTGLMLSWPISGIADDGEVNFNTVRVDGRNYVNLADFIRYYRFSPTFQQKDLNIKLDSKYRKLKFTLNSRECFFNGVRLWLNDPLLEYHHSILISEMDVRKTLHPILRPWSVPRLRIKTIMIDPGHGGEDKGTLGYRGTYEKRLTLDLAARVEKCLQKTGFRTLMTRRRDTYVSLEDRSQLANSSDADLFLSLHFNSAKPTPQPEGIETYCLTPVGLSSTDSIRRRWGIGDFGAEPGNRFDSQNMLLAYLVQQKLLKAIPEAEDRGIKRARFFVIKTTEQPAILVESGFLSNPAEEKRILTISYREKLAAAIAEGIKYFTVIMNGTSVNKKPRVKIEK